MVRLFMTQAISLSLLATLCAVVTASPFLPSRTELLARELRPRTTPYFPSSPPSCPICEKDYPSINSCAEAAPVLQNFTQIIFNPGAFIDVIKCACADTFQSVFPQCVDCFIRTNQSDILNTPDLPGVVDGMRKICAIESALLGNVSTSNGETGTATNKGAPPAPTNNHALQSSRGVLLMTSMLLFVSTVLTVL